MSTVKGQLIEPHWLLVTVDSPDTGHAISLKEIEGIEEVRERYKGSYKGIILQSTGSRFFSAGGNLKKYRKMDRRTGIKTNRTIRRYWQEFTSLSIPTVAIADGDAYGGGMEVLSAFDYVISTPQSYFGFWQRRIGLIFGWGGGRRLLSRMSDRALRSRSLKAKTVSAIEAQRLGVVDQVVARSFALDEALRWLKGMDKLPKEPVEFLKSRTWEKEEKYFEKIWLNKDHQSILKRFI